MYNMDYNALMNALMSALSSNSGSSLGGNKNSYGSGFGDIKMPSGTTPPSTAAAQAGQTPSMANLGSALSGATGSSGMSNNGNDFYNPYMSGPDYGSGIIAAINRSKESFGPMTVSDVQDMLPQILNIISKFIG